MKAQIGLGWILCCGVWAVAAVANQPSVPDLQPSPTLTPRQVIEFQLEVLRHNDELSQNRGIERAFRFASPNNRSVTGSLEHFAQIVNQPDYSALLHAASYIIGRLEFDEDQARSVVTVTTTSDERVSYVFILSRQTEGAFKDCWMTDAVLRVPSDEEENDNLIHA